MVQSYRKMLETGNIFWLCSVFFVKQFFCQTIKDNFWGSHSAWNLLGVFSRELSKNWNQWNQFFVIQLQTIIFF